MHSPHIVFPQVRGTTSCEPGKKSMLAEIVGTVCRLASIELTASAFCFVILLLVVIFLKSWTQFAAPQQLSQLQSRGHSCRCFLTAMQ